MSETATDDLIWALDPGRFAREALAFAPDPWQERVLRWSGKRLLLNCSRQSGKSTTVAAKALHEAVYTPRAMILMISPSLRQSGELFRKVQDHLRMMEIAPALLEETKLFLTLSNRSRIVSLPSKEGTIRGYSGATLIIEDEASRVPEDLYRAIRPMLAVSGGRLLLLSTPWGTRGHFFEAWAKGGPDWERIEVPAALCPRIRPEFLAEEQRTLGEYFFRQEYGCEFLDAVTASFRRVDIEQAFSEEVETWAL